MSLTATPGVLPDGSDKFFEAVEHRRTYYNLTSTLPANLTDSKVLDIIQKAITLAPNPFNIQESRAILVTGSKHVELWELVKATYTKVLPDEAAVQAAKEQIDAQYIAGYGTVLFFEDLEVVNQWEKNMPSLGAIFHEWSANAAGIVQYITWTALEAEGLGANLQHHGGYSAETQAGITKMFGVPDTWKSTALMPFGVPSGGPGKAAHPKTHLPIDDRVKVFLG